MDDPILNDINSLLAEHRGRDMADKRRAGEPDVREVGGRFRSHVHEKSVYGWVVYEYYQDPSGIVFPQIVASKLTEADADLLATGPARLAPLEAANGRLRAVIRDMLPLACCTCEKSPLGCVILTASCPFCRARAALADVGEPGGV